MNASQRMVLNAAATYTRSVLAVGLALFSSRWVLNSLGQTDFGLFSIVGSIIIFITFLNSIMAGSASRHFAYSIGRGDSEDVNRWFNAALSIHLCFAAGLVLIGWPIGEYVIAHILTIPIERISACLWVFRVSLISAFVSMLSIPFTAMFTAQQHIAEMAVWGLLQSILTFTLAYFLTQASGDRLLFYAIGMVVIIVFIQSAQIIRAINIFRECRIVIGQWFDKRRFKEISSFAVWTLLGGLGATLRDQGSAILLNLFFGPKVNAAYGIGTQVSTQTNQLSASLMGAFSPEITASEGRGDRVRMLSLAQRANKFGTILVMLFAIPLMVEMDFVLKLWLREPPLYTALFCRLILCTFMIDRLSSGYMLAVNAHGKIAAYQATLGTSLLLTLPIAWVFFKLGYAPTSVGIAFIITMIVCSIGRVFWVRRLLGVSVQQWLNNVVWPSFIIALVAVFVAVIPSWFLPVSFFRLVISSSGSIAISLLTAWFLAFDPKEHEFIIKNIRRITDKIYGVNDIG